MDRRTFLGAMIAATLPFPARADQCRDADANAADVRWLIDQIEAQYAYLPDRHVDMAKLRAIYVPEAHAVCEPHAFLSVLERLLAELHDHHIEANVNNADFAAAGADRRRSLGRVPQRSGGDRGRASRQRLREGRRARWRHRHRHRRRAGRRRPSPPPCPARSARPIRRPTTTRCASCSPVRTASRAISRVQGNAGSKRIVLPPFERTSSMRAADHRAVIDDVAILRVENSLGDSERWSPTFDRALDESRRCAGR